MKNEEDSKLYIMNMLVILVNFSVALHKKSLDSKQEKKQQTTYDNYPWNLGWFNTKSFGG